MKITKLRLSNFKSFESFETEWGDFNVLVGANNSGKTSLFQALRFICRAMEKTVRTDARAVHFAKTQITELSSVAAPEPRDLFFNQRLRPERVNDIETPGRINLVSKD